MPYNLIVVKELIQMGCTVHIVRWTKCNTPYVPSELPNVNYYDRNTFANVHSLLHKVREIKPDLIWVSGWIDKLYCRVVGLYRKEHDIPFSFLLLDIGVGLAIFLCPVFGSMNMLVN